MTLSKDVGGESPKIEQNLARVVVPAVTIPRPTRGGQESVTGPRENESRGLEALPRAAVTFDAQMDLVLDNPNRERTWGHMGTWGCRRG